jgi:predicted transposase YbfD/YdcC
MDYNQLEPQQEIDEIGIIYHLDSLYAYLMQVPDPRKAKGKQYPLPSLLILILLAKLGGEDKPSGITDWVAYRIESLARMKVLPKAKAPCQMTYRRVLQDTLEPEEFERLMSEYHQNCLETGQEILLSLDGKTVRGTIPSGATQGTHLLSIYVPQQGLVLAEMQVDRKENEIVVAPRILEQVQLSGVIVMGDALHTQRETSSQIVEAGGDYLWTVKTNQPRTHWAIEKLFVHEAGNLRQGAPLSKDVQTAVQVNKGHGRIEKRTIWVSTALNDYLDWPYVAQVFRIERLVWHEKYRGRTRQIVYGLTSLPRERAAPKRLLTLNRAYWGIENGLHYRRDVTLQEDATRLTLRNAGHNMAILNNIIVGLCFQNGYENLASARRLFCARPEEALKLILSG